MDILSIVGLICIAVVVGAILYVSQSSAKNKELVKQLVSRTGSGDIFVSSWDSSFIGFNFVDRKLIVGKGDYSAELAFSQLIQADLLRDEVVLTSTSGGSLAARAITGAVLFGGVGAAVGAVTAKSQSVSSVNQLSLRLMTDAGAHTVVFFDMKSSGQSLPAQTLSHITAEADRVYGLALRAIRSASEHKSAVVTRVPDSLAQEIEKLWHLKQSGAISNAEYDAAKQAILK